MTAAADTKSSPWHAGEVALQSSVGAAERMADVGRRVIRDRLSDQHRSFYPLLPFAVFGAVDGAGDAWATLRAGAPGFLQAPDTFHLEVDLQRDASDPAEAGLDNGDAVALLGFDASTRRRNRLNGTLRRACAGRFSIEVGQSFGNCPRYIQRRSGRLIRDPRVTSPMAPYLMGRGDARVRAMIAGADTLFVASYVDDEHGRQIDVSHRGGRPGFVRVGSSGNLTIPDFAGNRFFNTLGNMLVNPRAGLAFVDWERGDLLQMTGGAEVALDAPELAAFEGAERLWRFTPTRIVLRPDALPLRFPLMDDGWSPDLVKTGTWAEAEERTGPVIAPRRHDPGLPARPGVDAGLRS